MGMVSGRRSGDFFISLFQSIHIDDMLPAATMNKATGKVVKIYVPQTKEGVPVVMHFIDHVDFRRCPVFLLFLLIHLHCAGLLGTNLLDIITEDVKRRTHAWKPNTYESYHHFNHHVQPVWWKLPIFSTAEKRERVSAALVWLLLKCCSR